jgi:hypothetical protein
MSLAIDGELSLAPKNALSVSLPIRSSGATPFNLITFEWNPSQNNYDIPFTPTHIRVRSFKLLMVYATNSGISIAPILMQSNLTGNYINFIIPKWNPANYGPGNVQVVYDAQIQNSSLIALNGKDISNINFTLYTPNGTAANPFSATPNTTFPNYYSCLQLDLYEF